MAEANARIFREMQAADDLRQQMREGILNRFRESNIGRAIGNVYDSDMAKGMAGAMNDIYRRTFEQWFGGDVFDGRFAMDNRIGQGQPERSVEGMADQYDLRASYYGWDTHRDSGVEGDNREQAHRQEIDQEMER